MTDAKVLLALHPGDPDYTGPEKPYEWTNAEGILSDPDVVAQLNATYVNKPSGVADGQVPVWQASTSTWIPGTPAGASNLDGGNASSVYTGTFNFDGGGAS